MEDRNSGQINIVVAFVGFALIVAGHGGWAFFGLGIYCLHYLGVFTAIKNDIKIAGIVENVAKQISATPAKTGRVFATSSPVPVTVVRRDNIPKREKPAPAAIYQNNARHIAMLKKHGLPPVNGLGFIDNLANTPSGLPSLLSELANEQRILVHGESGSGKTTVLRWLVEARRGVVVLDPHYAPGTWGDVKVFGGGRNYQQINIVLNGIVAEMSRRYTARTKYGDAVKFPEFTVLIDEGYMVMQNCADAPMAVKTLLTEARKVRINIILANHSTLVRALGLERASDLKQGFCLVHLTNIDGRHGATIDKGDGAYEVEPPRAHPEIERLKLQEGKIDYRSIMHELPTQKQKTIEAPDERIRQIEIMLNAGMSKNKIYEVLGGNRNEVWGLFKQVEEAVSVSNSRIKQDTGCIKGFDTDTGGVS